MLLLLMMIWAANLKFTLNFRMQIPKVAKNEATNQRVLE
jgi:hypothetical protein